MPPVITASSLQGSGIELTACDDPNFDDLVRSLFLGEVPALLRLKPFLVIITNYSQHTLVAYTVRWRAGRSVRYCQAKYPDAQAPEKPKRDNEIRPGEHRVVAMSVELQHGHWEAPTETFFLEQFEKTLRQVFEHR